MPVTATGLRHERRTETYPPGSIRVSTDQPLGALVAYLLEPESDDSFFAWGFFTDILQRVEYMEPYAIAPMAERMLESDPQMRAEFEQASEGRPSLRRIASPTPAVLLRTQPFLRRPLSALSGGTGDVRLAVSLRSGPPSRFALRRTPFACRSVSSLVYHP